MSWAQPQSNDIPNVYTCVSGNQSLSRGLIMVTKAKLSQAKAGHCHAN